MAIKFEKIQAGMTLYDRHRVRMGNTTMRTLGEWTVRVLEVNADDRSALVSWNGNAPERRRDLDLRALFDWSMRDKDQAIVDRSATISMLVYRITRRKPCPQCKARHASEECPHKKETQ